MEKEENKDKRRTPHQHSGWDMMVGRSGVSEEVMIRIAKKKELMGGRKLFNCETRAPAPSKDFCHLLITEKGILWRRWKISLRGMTSGSAPVPQPVEDCLTHLEFKCDDALVVSN